RPAYRRHCHPVRPEVVDLGWRRGGPRVPGGRDVRAPVAARAALGLDGDDVPDDLGVTVEQMALRPSHVQPRTLAEIAARIGGAAPDGADAVAGTGASVDSRAVEPGDLFGASAGLRAHGATFAAQAVETGAAAILTDAEGARLCADAVPGTPVLVAERTRDAMGEASALVYGDPSTKLTFVGVTGTNGKTTTSYFIDNAFAQVHPHRGILGTVELRVKDEAIESPRTTVEAPVLHGLLARMVEEGVTAAVTEVSSHAAALDRIAGVDFAVA